MSSSAEPGQEMQLGFDADVPLERMPGESLRANQALRDYVFMGSARSLRKLLAEYKGRVQRGREEGTDIQDVPTVRISRLQEWSTRFHWQGRVSAYERLLDIEREDVLRRRRIQLQDREWEMSDYLFAVSKEALLTVQDFIHEKTVEDEDGQLVVYKKLDAWQVAKAAELGSDLGRRATGMNKDKTLVEHSGSIAGPALNAPNFSGMKEDELNDAIRNIILATLPEGTLAGGADREAPAQHPGGETGPG